jgi:uncharacterized protein (UPF0276 family)
VLSDDGFEGDAGVAHLHFAGAEYDAQQNLVQPHPDSTPDIVYSVYLVYLARIEMRHVTRNIDIEHRNEACERFSTKKKNEGGPWGHDTDILTYIY